MRTHLLCGGSHCFRRGGCSRRGARIGGIVVGDGSYWWCCCCIYVCKLRWGEIARHCGGVRAHVAVRARHVARTHLQLAQSRVMLLAPLESVAGYVGGAQLQEVSDRQAGVRFVISALNRRTVLCTVGR